MFFKYRSRERLKENKYTSYWGPPKEFFFWGGGKGVELKHLSQGNICQNLREEKNILGNKEHKK